MRAGAAVLTSLLVACGAGGEPSGQSGSPAHSPAGAASAPAAPAASAQPTVGNPLIGVWARVSGGACRFDPVEFTAATVTFGDGGPERAMQVLPVVYDLADPRSPAFTPKGSATVHVRVIDPDHLGDGACVLARAD